jgi:hypothetical protein
MASLDTLPADQKAVLSLVLQRGRSFDQIAQLLSIDRGAVRQRALEGFDALGPETTLEPLKRALITDFLLGQLPPAVATNVANSLAHSPAERAWARVIAAEISPLAAAGLPEIPAAGATSAPAGPAATGTDDDAAAAAATTGAGPAAAGTTAPEAAAPEVAGPTADVPGAPRSSRRGGAILLGLIVLVVVVVVVILLLTGSKTKHHAKAHVVQTPPPSTSTVASGTSTTVSTLDKLSLVSPTSVKGRQGAAAVVRASGELGLVLAAEGLPANTNNAYGVWLYNSKTTASDFLGFYGKKVAGSGKTKGDLEAEVKLPSGATRYNELLLTLETAEKPTKPGTIVLEGPFAE